MYCPKCGQSPLSGDVQFCTRCGLSLRVVKELIMNDGVTVEKSENEVQGIELSQRRKGTRLGAKLVFWGLVFVPITLAFGFLVKSPLLFIMSLIIVLAGLGRMLYARLFEEVQWSAKHHAQAVLARTSGLPGSLEVLSKGPNSYEPGPGEVMAPPSITEHTTKLLDS
jgi:hypothetical protein